MREFHVLRSQLRAEKWSDILEILNMRDVEARVKRLRNGR